MIEVISSIGQEPTVLLGLGFLMCSVLLMFGCACHLFGKPYSINDVEAGGQAPYCQDSIADSSIVSDITFDPLPDILAKTVFATALKPKIVSTNRERQRDEAKELLNCEQFPRSQLVYVKEFGMGWFGQALEAYTTDGYGLDKSEKVIVRKLKDDAYPGDKLLFLEDIVPFFQLEHKNILSLLGLCTESHPYLAVFEYSQPHGDLKSYLRSHHYEANVLVKNGVLLQFLVDASAGLGWLHMNGYVHNDLASRNCVVMPDLTVKIGDYGIAEDHYREDYYDSGQELLPIRWMAPESLFIDPKKSIWQVAEVTNITNVWSFGVLMWEVLEFGRQPFEDLRDEEVLQQVFLDKTLQLKVTRSKAVIKQRLNEVVQFCWLQPHQRLSSEDIHTLLVQIKHEKDGEMQKEFEAKWQMASPNDPAIESQSHNPSLSIEANVHDTPSLRISKTDDDSGVTGSSSARHSSTVSSKNSSKGLDSLYSVKFSEDEPSMIESDGDLDSHVIETPTRNKISVETKKVKERELSPVHTPVTRSPQKQTYQMTSTPASASKKQGETTLSDLDKKQTSSDVVNSESDNDSLGANSVQFVEIDNSENESKDSEDSDKVNSEQLKMLKKSIEQALGPTKKTSSNNAKRQGDQEDLGEHEGKTSPKDEYDLAREIYMSKGTVLPSRASASRNLSTIPEDSVPMSSSPAQQIKFDDSDFSSGVQDTFEWDDYIGDELVGKVRYSDESPSHLLEFTDWTMEQASSDSDSNTSRGNQDNSDVSGSSAGSKPNSPFGSSGSEDSNKEDSISEKRKKKKKLKKKKKTKIPNTDK